MTARGAPKKPRAEPTPQQTPSGEAVVLDRADYEALMERLEDLTDDAVARRVMAAEPEETIPFEMSKRITAGEMPLRVWREFRGLKAAELARRARISAPYLSELEHGKRDGSLAGMARLADALDVLVDDLVPANMSESAAAETED